jgi:dipeptidyl aminopeptidase/acylaminoacyl peptidase
VSSTRYASAFRCAPLIAALALVACDEGTMQERAPSDAAKLEITTSALRVLAAAAAPEAHAAPAPVTAAPPERVAPLRVPERVASGRLTESRGGWNRAVRDVTYPTDADGTRQPMMFYAPRTDDARPLLVALHSWSATYRQGASAICAEWAIANDWAFIHPHFRGRNVRPEATGSELVIADVLSAIDYAKQNARVDERRIYSVGWSGVGHLALLLAGREPAIWAGVSAWVPISDLNAWYRERCA